MCVHVCIYMDMHIYVYIYTNIRIHIEIHVPFFVYRNASAAKWHGHLNARHVSALRLVLSYSSHFFALDSDLDDISAIHGLPPATETAAVVRGTQQE